VSSPAIRCHQSQMNDYFALNWSTIYNGSGLWIKQVFNWMNVPYTRYNNLPCPCYKVYEQHKTTNLRNNGRCIFYM